MPRSSILCILGLFLCCAGCSKSGSQRASVSGFVQLDGKPLVSGAINFIPVDPAAGPTAGAAVKDGRYQIDRAKGVILGENQVRINSTQRTGKQIVAFGQLTDEWTEVVPDEYNARTTLVRLIQPGTNVLDFNLRHMP